MSGLSEPEAPGAAPERDSASKPEPISLPTPGRTLAEIPGNALVTVPEPIAPEVEDLVRRLREGQTFVSLRIDDPDRRAHILARILAQIASDAVKLVWTGNPLRSPFTIDRLMLQAAGPEADLRVDYGPDQLAAMLAEIAGEHRRAILIVQQPETIDKVTRETLSRMAPHLAAAPRPVQLLFCGSTAFNPLDTLSRPPVPILSLRAPTRADGLTPAPAPRRSAPGPTLALATLLCVACAVVYALHLAHQPAPERVRESVAEPTPPKILDFVPSADAATTPAAGLPTPGRPAPAPAASDIDALHREFDQFLATQPGLAASLTAAQRDELFREYLRRSQLTRSQP